MRSLTFFNAKRQFVIATPLCLMLLNKIFFERPQIKEKTLAFSVNVKRIYPEYFNLSQKSQHLKGGSLDNGKSVCCNDSKASSHSWHSHNMLNNRPLRMSYVAFLIRGFFSTFALFFHTLPR